jgi:two-component system, sensor histidine kinase
LALLSQRASEKGLALTYKDKGDLECWFRGDVTRIRQILVNLLSNAIKFTDKGEVSVTLLSKKLKDKKIQIALDVRDSGIGISEKAQKKLFEDFSQADNSTTRKYGGTGLGLSICSKLAKLMKGKVTLKSERGKGSVFRLQLILEEGVCEEIAEVKSEKENTSLLSETFYHKILVVEDNLINQKLVKLMLKKLGYECDMAGNGLEALEMFKKQKDEKYTLVFMDIQMAEMDGLTATKKIIEKYKDQAPPIVALTANAFAYDKALCKGAGMIDFVPKPVKLTELERVLVQTGTPAEKVS